MEVWEEDSDCLSCRASDFSDLEELEANLYSYVHHERNSYFDEESSAECCVSQLEDQSQNISNSGNSENTVVTSDGISYENPQSFEENKTCANVCVIGHNEEIVESANKLKRTEPEVTFERASPAHSSRGTPTKYYIGGLQSRRSPSVIDLSSSDDLDALEKRDSNHSIGATSTPYKECVVLDDSDDEIQIELERVKIKSKKQKKRKKSTIITDIKLNTHRKNKLMSYDCGDDHIFPQIDHGDPMESSSEYHASGTEPSLTKSWTPQMVKFYDESWGGEYINVYELQRSMSDNGWAVDLSDEFYCLTSKLPSRRYYGSNPRAWCTQCNRKGHFRNECKVRPEAPRCHRCGSSAHQEYSCSEKLCLTCGKRWPFLVVACKHCRQLSMKKCQVCRQPGHPTTCCPDLWRRFHATVHPGEIVSPPKVLYKDPRNAYCCNCASRGHHVYQCKENSFSEYVPISPHITSYLDPELWLKFNSSCSNPSSNWENYGEANRYDAEMREYGEKRSVKRPKNSNHSRKAKLMKFSEGYPQPTKNSENNCGSQHTNVGVNHFEQCAFQSTPKANQRSLRNAENSSGRNQNDHFLGYEGNFNTSNSISGYCISSKDSNKLSAKEMVGGNDVLQSSEKNYDSSPRFMERIVILSPAQLNRLKSSEGREIIKYVTTQFEDVQVHVSGSPSGVERLTSGSNVEVLRLVGAKNNVDSLKVELFQILNGKSKGWEDWMSSMGIKSSHQRSKKGKKFSYATMDKTKATLKKKKKIKKNNRLKEQKKGTNPSLNVGNAKEMQSRKRKNVKTCGDRNEQLLASKIQIPNSMAGTSTHVQGTPGVSNNKLDSRSPNVPSRKNNPAEGNSSPRAVPGGSQTKPNVKNHGRNKKRNKRAPNNVAAQDKLRSVRSGNAGKKKRKNKGCKKNIVDNLKSNGIGKFKGIHVEVGNYVMGLNRKVSFSEESRKYKNHRQQNNGDMRKSNYFPGMDPCNRNRSIQIFSA